MKQLQVKYCGNKSLEDLKVTAESNADYLGFIFAESKRQVQSAKVNQWLKEVDVGKKRLVGVFVNATLSEIVDTVLEVPLSIIQCHGTESKKFIQDVKRATNKPVWKVIHHSENGVSDMKVLSGIVDGFVVDSKVKGMWGGSGQRFDWSFIPSYIEEARIQHVPCFIAGGLNAENIRELLTYPISGIDISSGIEEDNRKNKTIINNIEEQVKKYEGSTRS